MSKCNKCNDTITPYDFFHCRHGDCPETFDAAIKAQAAQSTDLYEGRQYWIEGNIAYSGHVDGQDKDAVHVIEYNSYESLLKSNEELLNALKLAKKMNRHIFEKGTVNWGKTFVRWDIMNDSMIAVEQVLRKRCSEKENGTKSTAADKIRIKD